MEWQELHKGEVAERYLNGQLDPATQDEFELHILECLACQQKVELLQTVRDDLAAHAHEIRAYSPAPRGYLRFAWIAITGLVVVGGGIGVRQVLVQQQGHTPVARNIPSVVSSPPAESPGVNSQLASRSRADSGMKVAGKGRAEDPVRLPHARNETTAAIKTRPTHTIDNLPLDARDYINYPKGNPSLRDSAPATQSNSETVAEATVQANPQENAVVPSVVAQPASSADLISHQIAELATVRPFPYTFAGVARSQPSGGGTARTQRQTESALSGNAGTVAKPGATGFSTAQDYFREGMSAYVGRDYETAVKLLTQAVMLEPDFSAANLYLGICKLLRGSPSGAASPLQIAAKEEKKPALAQAAHYFLAKTYLQLGKLADAESEFRVAAALPGRLAGESNELLQRLDDIRSESGRK